MIGNQRTEFFAICHNIVTFAPGSYASELAEKALGLADNRALDAQASAILNALSSHKGHRILELKARLRTMTMRVSIAEREVNRPPTNSYRPAPRRSRVMRGWESD